jgi:Mrp family chromosome partitioning ATPase
VTSSLRETTAIPQGSRANPPLSALRLHPVRSLRRHKVAALVGAALAAAAAREALPLLRRPVYRAEATVLISPVFARNLTDDRELQIQGADFQLFVQQQVATLVRADVLTGALDRLGPCRALWQRAGEGPQQAVARLRAALRAARVAETSYVVVELEGDRPDGLAETANAVAEAYLARVKSQPFVDLGERVAALTRLKAQLQGQIRARMDQIDRWAEETGTSHFEPEANRRERQEVERRLNAARARRLEAEARLAALRARLDSALAADLGPEALNQLSADPELRGLRAALMARRIGLRSRALALTPEHAARKGIEGEMAEIDAELARAEASARRRIQEALEERLRDRIEGETRALEAELERAKEGEAEAAAEAAALARRTVRLARIALDVRAERNALDRLKRRLDAVNDRLDAIRLESTAPGFVHLVSPADPPVKPARRGGLPWVLAFGLAVVGMAFAGPLALDAVDRRVRKPADLDRVVDVPALGWVPERRRRTKPLVREQIRRLALALDRERRDHRRRCFAFLALAPGAGTTGLVLDLGCVLQRLGVRTLAIEANPLRPDARFAPWGGPGLVDVLSGDATFEEAVLPATDSKPERLPWGRAMHPRLASSDAMIRAVIDRAGCRYAVILVDAPPLPASSDAEWIAGAADLSILVVRAGAKLHHVLRSIRLLRRSTPRAVGILVNGVRAPRFRRGARLLGMR